MRLDREIEQRLKTELSGNDYDKIIQAQVRTGMSVEELIDFSERNWLEDKFFFDDDKEVLREIFIDFNSESTSQEVKAKYGLDKKTAVIVFSEFSYLDIATAILLNADEEPVDIPGKVWDYVIGRAAPPSFIVLGDDGFAEAEQDYVNLVPAFSNRDAEGSGFTKDSIAMITKHLTQLGYFGSRTI